MRNFTEPSARNLLRRGLVLGVPLFGLVLLAFCTLLLSVFAGTNSRGNLLVLGFGGAGYLALRVVSRFSKTGWEEEWLYRLERSVKLKSADGVLKVTPSEIEVVSPDTLEQTDLIVLKDGIQDRISRIKPGERLTVLAELGEEGAVLSEVQTQGRSCMASAQSIEWLTSGLIDESYSAYSLHQLPVATDPLWSFGLLSGIPKASKVVVSVRGVDPREIKRRIEVSRRGNAQGDAAISDVDADVNFEDASRVLQGLSRGEETVVELSLVILSKERLDLDEGLFCWEKCLRLPVLSVLGIRKRFHRSHYVRAVTAADLIPNVLDPREPGSAILTTLRGLPLYFSPQDPRLEALHWLVVGASGSGKSFFTGLVLKRMVEQGCPMSVLFVDHNRSFKRLVRNHGKLYAEPQTIADLPSALPAVYGHLEGVGALVGIELSDLPADEKKPAIHLVLSGVEAFLRHRASSHPVYLVLDECWNFMRDEPLLVQRAFREFRKLNGAAIAITQSLSDFLTDASGQSIFQNAPVRILLRQGEDLNRYQGILGLNEVELRRARFLKQRKGQFSECLIKTPFLSRLGRLYPTAEEHELLRTDNLREELVQEVRRRQAEERGERCFA